MKKIAWLNALKTIGEVVGVVLGYLIILPSLMIFLVLMLMIVYGLYLGYPILSWSITGIIVMAVIVLAIREEILGWDNIFWKVLQNDDEISKLGKFELDRKRKRFKENLNHLVAFLFIVVILVAIVWLGENQAISEAISLFASEVKEFFSLFFELQFIQAISILILSLIYISPLILVALVVWRKVVTGKKWREVYRDLKR